MLRGAAATGEEYRRPPLPVAMLLGLAGFDRDVGDPWWRRRIWMEPDERDLAALDDADAAEIGIG